MFVPLYDFNPLRAIRRPYVTYALIAVNVAVFVLFQSGLVFDADDRVIATFAFVPAGLSGVSPLPPGYMLLPEPVKLVTYMFLHGGFAHLIGNMLFLWVFGDNVEDDMGHVRFTVFYLLVGVAGGLFHALMTPESPVPLIGASGAISGVVIAYAMLHPRVKLWVLVLMRLPLKISAIWAIGAWVTFQVLSFLGSKPDDPTAWAVHVGGIVAGALLVLVLRRPGVRLFDPQPQPLPVPPTHTLTPKAGGH